jgi:hypothetical protein
MVACNFDNRFVHVNARWEGSASDARVLQDALQNNFYMPEGTFYLVDAEYANTTNFIAPYRNVRYDSYSIKSMHNSVIMLNVLSAF